eukprot:XP_025980944.1 uncharacterized protein LOC106795676 [Glycine max]
MGSEKVEKHIKVAIFISKISWVQRRWKKTLKLPFFTPKSLHFYLIFMSKGLSPLFLCLHVRFLCFCVSPSSFFVPLHSSSFIFCFLCFFVSPTSIFVHLHSSSYSVLLLFLF